MDRTGTVSAIWDEDVTPVWDVDEDRIRTAVDKARDAFWTSIGESFPEVRTGDMGPGDGISFEWATNEIVVTWLYWNHPSNKDAS